MTLDIQLKLQAYLDGELPAGEARAIEELLANDPAARDQFAELTNTKTALHGNELPATLNETRDFYWSQIARRIEIENRREASVSRRSSLLGWRRILAALAGAAAVYLLIFTTTFHPARSASALASVADEVETSSDQVEAVTYQDHQANMTVVWLQARPTSFTTAAVDDSLQPQ